MVSVSYMSLVSLLKCAVWNEACPVAMQVARSIWTAFLHTREADEELCYQAIQTLLSAHTEQATLQECLDRLIIAGWILEV